MPPRRESGMLLPDGVDPENLPDPKTLRRMMREQRKNAPRDKIFKRILGYVIAQNKLKFFIAMLTMLVAAIISALSSMAIITLANDFVWTKDLTGMPTYVLVFGAIFFVGAASSGISGVLMAKVGQGTLYRLRNEMFSKMQRLPIRYFDQHQSGDIMSCFTNDIDALRQFITQTIPQLVNSGTIIIACVGIMLYYSLWLTIVVGIGIAAMFLVVRKIGGASARFFMTQQKTLGRVNGYIEESMVGQKVIKVFCHEQQAKADFDQKNEELFKVASNANSYANILMPVMGNIGNIMYVLIAVSGSFLYVLGGINFGIVSLVDPSMSILAITIGFLTMTRSFTQNIAAISQQINFVAMALAGGRRVFAVIDEQPEHDDGYVELVQAKRLEGGELVETTEQTGIWAWKHPHRSSGITTYAELQGDIEMHDVDFAYVTGKTVLHDVTLYARPGQKVAFVGATGAGKTTITNLINRFYDIEDGKVRYDGININKIKKSDLRRSLGMVLQDTSLFTGTIMENIRYGKLDATDEEVIAASKLANAHDFISRLPDGYQTVLESDGANLSQGQRQLLSIARTACKNAPVLILDEATSSIDTHTEMLVQNGMDKIMQNRTVFVIAHRLSTIRNSDVIMVLDKGRIIERGTHKQLISEGGTYYSLYTGMTEIE